MELDEAITHARDVAERRHPRESLRNFGETVFLARDEAEAALKRLEVKP